MDVWEINLLDLIKSGGPIMIPILLCSFFALTIILEKLYYFSFVRKNTVQLKVKVFDYVKSNKTKEALELCENNPTPLAKILKAGLIKFGASREEIKESIEEASLFEVPKLEKGLTALSTIAHLAPLLGLLGTVVGVAVSFHSIQLRAAALNPLTPADLTFGVWQALITTIAGLIVAIPAYLTYNYFVSQAGAFILEMERGATELINLLCHLTEGHSSRET